MKLRCEENGSPRADEYDQKYFEYIRKLVSVDLPGVFDYEFFKL